MSQEKKNKILIDGDSICYASGFKPTLGSCYVSILDRLGEILWNCNSTDYEIWIESWEDKDIFRNNLATTKPYKGNRSEAEKPEFLIEAKKFLVDFYNTNVTINYESEDMCLIRATELGRENCTIAFIDKDLLQAPFRYYNYQKKEFISLSEKEAEIRLYRQILTGDPTDNIPGVYRFGPKKAEKLINEKTVNIPLEVAKTYKEKGYDYDYLVEQARLIYLIRHKDEAVNYVYPISRKEYNNIETKEKSK